MSRLFIFPGRVVILYSRVYICVMPLYVCALTFFIFPLRSTLLFLIPEFFVLSPEFYIQTESLKDNIRYPSENMFKTRNVKSVRYNTETLAHLGPKIWSIIPIDIKEENKTMEA